MNRDVLAAVISEVRRSQNLSAEMRIGPETILLGGGLTLDSVGVLELLLALETRFSCEIPEHEVTEENLSTIGTLVQLLGRLSESDV